MTIQLIQGIEKTVQVTIEAINFIHDDYIKMSICSILHQLRQLRTPAILLGGDPRIRIDLDKIPTSFSGKLSDVVFLRVQAKTIHLFTH
ncbi:MAG: hypothetical protein QY328_13530 [Anaerolineales bacterium]|nr:MAG: hypothetical protein QY328_13530 [Anaerolineales bacterium]